MYSHSTLSLVPISMVIYCSGVLHPFLGSDGYTCQIPRIKEGIEQLGHTLSEDSPDLIYSNDPKGYVRGLELKEKYPNAYLILTF